MGWSLMIFCARATRGRALPSLDARSGRSIRPHPWERTSELGGGEGMVRCLFCSQNAYGEKEGKDTHVGPVLPERAP